jgi:hypothetical protein
MTILPSTPTSSGAANADEGELVGYRLDPLEVRSP